MPNKFAEATQRNFDRMSAPKLSDDARKAVNAAFGAMSTWREQIVNEKNSEQVIEKMAEAARKLGWPEQIVDATRTQMEAITKMQIQTMDHLMDTWEAQIKSPNSSSTMLSKLTSLPNFGPVGSNSGNPQMAALNGFELYKVYMQTVQQWQKAWVDLMASLATSSARR